MEKNRIRPVKIGNGVRMSFSKQKEVLEMPNLIEVQTKSYQWFLEEGLKEVFRDISPITDHSGKLSLEFLDYDLRRDEAKHTIEECKERNVTYSAPLYANVRLNKGDEDGEMQVTPIFMGEIPLMTATGTFVINGAERVIVSQLVRSPGIYYDIAHDKTGKKLFSSTVIPYRGAWLEYETDSNDVFWVKVDRNSKLPVTSLIRALGVGSNQEIIDLFGDEPKIQATFLKDNATDCDTGLLEVYKKLRPGDPVAVDSARSLIEGSFYDVRKYDLAKVGRYKYNKKLAFCNRVTGFYLAEEVVNPMTGEIYEKDTLITEELARELQNTGTPYIYIYSSEEKERKVKILSNLMVDLNAFVDVDKEEVGITEDVYYPVLKQLMEENPDIEDLKAAIRMNVAELIPKHITREDIFTSINYNIHLEYNIGNKDDIDHLGNRRIRGVGELLQMQYRTGMFRMERTVRERMSSMQPEMITGASSLINIKPVTAAVKEFFGSSQLSQFMDQNNPLSELTHKRRLSALGPGGLSRDRAGFEVRDVHYSHYGRMCPVETPEGPNIGLINSLASYARINEYGFIEAPYRKADKSDPNNPRITDEVVYMTADDEDRYVVAQANEILDENGCFVRKVVSGRFREETSEFPKSKIDFMDVSPKMVFSVATAMIPFLENDDANRALMGSNMQRQAVPLLVTEPPVVGTGMERKAAVDSGNCVLAENDGVVTFVASDKIVVDENGSRHEYKLEKFVRSNQGTCMNQRPIVSKGDTVTAGQVIADGPSTANGEIALGKNPLIGFMTWEGYNYEDAVLLSERLVKEDVYTSVHINEYEIEARETKLGAEEITKDVPGVGQESLKYLDSRGIIMPGTEVRAGDILVGKVTPKGETELTAEERLLRAIFAEKAREVRNASLYVPHGEFGIVVDVKIFDREDSGSDLQPGVNRKVRVYIAQKRKIQVGDKMAGRHGNKGVVSRVLPVEDMPFLPNGRPLDIVLNPLGVPSRMNIGQVLEIHLSLASKVLGFNVATPVFDGANENDIMDMLEMANDYVNTPLEDFEAKYKDILDPEVMDYLLTNQEYRKEWAGVPINRDGKVRLRDGRTGEYFDGAVTIGFMHYLKLHHLVDDKIHARSTGPYSLVTQQPLGGKAQFGGQRFGEMEVWALEAYGAAYTLQEILTVKSDDVIGRVKAYEAIIKGDNVEKPGIPESFKVLLKELQSLALDVTVLDEEGQEIPMTENLDTGDEELTPLIEEEPGFRYNEDDNFADAGYHESSADEESGVFGSFEIGELDDDEDEEPLDDDLEDDEFTDSEIICPNCGAVIGYGETECSECGTKL